MVIPFAGLPEVTAQRLRELAQTPCPQDHPRHEGKASSRLAVYNLHHNAAASAELAMALLLACAKRLVPIHGRFSGGDWSDRGRWDQARGLEGRRALVLGYGAIGRRVARACEGLGLRVEVLARRPRQDGAREVHGPAALPQLLKESEVLVVCLPATASTRGLLGAAELASLPPHALLVNVARGPIIDEGALYEALASGHLFGAGLDVWWRYPKPSPQSHSAQSHSAQSHSAQSHSAQKSHSAQSHSAQSEETRPVLFPAEHPFHELESVVLSPHRAGHVEDTELQRARALAEVLLTLAEGKEPHTRVDVQEGN